MVGKAQNIFNIPSFNLLNRFEVDKLENVSLDNTAISTDNIGDFEKKAIKGVFSVAVNLKQVQQDIKDNSAKVIHLKMLNGRFYYSLDKNDALKEIEDKSLIDLFNNKVQKLKKYVQNAGITERANLLAEEDSKLLAVCPTKIDQVSKRILKDHETDPSELSLWAIWFLDFKGVVNKICNFLIEAFSNSPAMQKFWEFIKKHLNEECYKDFKSVKEFVTKLGSYLKAVVQYFKNIAKKIPDGTGDTIAYFLSIWGVFKNILAVKTANKINDEEGKTQAKFDAGRTILALSATVLSTIYLAVKEVALDTSVGVLSILVAVAAMGRNIYFYNKCKKFQDKLNSYLNNESISKENRLKGALLFLKDKVSLNDLDLKKIIYDIKSKNPEISKEALENLVEKEAISRLLVKKKRFQRRVGFVAYKEINNNINKMLEKLDNNELDDVEAFLNGIKKLNKSKINENKWFAIATILIAVELALLLFLGFPTIAMLAGIASSLIFIIYKTYDLYNDSKAIKSISSLYENKVKK